MMLLLFHRKVIPLPEKDMARVECKITGFLDTEPLDIGQVNFPSKQTWTKFWGAIQKGALSVPDMKVEMQNVPADDGSMPSERLEKELTPDSNNPTQRWVGNQLVTDPK